MRSLVLEMSGALSAQFTKSSIESNEMNQALVQQAVKLFGIDAVEKSAIRFTDGVAV